MNSNRESLEIEIIVSLDREDYLYFLSQLQVPRYSSYYFLLYLRV